MDEINVTFAKDMTTSECNEQMNHIFKDDLMKNFLSHDPVHNDDDDCDCDSSDSLGTSSNEIPVWVHGEKRWISGVNDQTTCTDLVNVLLTDEDIEIFMNKGTNTGCNVEQQIERKCYVITERWRRVEQILPDDSKILPIWSAWGLAKSEVKLILRQIDKSILDGSNNNNNQSSLYDDSGMGSPNGSTVSAVIRRRRHRASKSTTAWIMQALTIHPKSQKATIEKLMKLILEQGETIQQQLVKLRDRELQITKIEEERHKTREKEHGKNYLLETYLNGLQEAEDKEISANSDSGVQTEGALSSPEVGSCIQEDEDFHIRRDDVLKCVPYKEKSSHREKKLLKEHKHTKQYTTMLRENASLSSSSGTTTRSSSTSSKSSSHQTNEYFNNNNNNNNHNSKDISDDLTAKIEWLERLVAINKHLQREEELLVRLGAKIRKYESENPLLNEKQIRDALSKVNSSIDQTTNEIKKIENDLITSNDQLNIKTNLLETLNRELIAIEEMESSTTTTTTTTTTASTATSVTPPTGKTMIIPKRKINFHCSSDYCNNNRMDNGINENLVENLYNYQQYISKPNYDFNEINENRDQKSIHSQYTTATISGNNNNNNSNNNFSMTIQNPEIKNLTLTTTTNNTSCSSSSSMNSNNNDEQINLNCPELLHNSLKKCQKIIQTPIFNNYNNNNNNIQTNEYPVLVNSTTTATTNNTKQIDLVTSMNFLYKNNTEQNNINNNNNCNGMNIYDIQMVSSKLSKKNLINGICPDQFESTNTNINTLESIRLKDDITQLGTLV